MSAAMSELLREAEYRNPGHMLYGHAAETIDELCGALERCRDQFAEYAALHLAKGTRDGILKAQVNADMANIVCGQALAKARGEQ